MRKLSNISASHFPIVNMVNLVICLLFSLWRTRNMHRLTYLNIQLFSKTADRVAILPEKLIFMTSRPIRRVNLIARDTVMPITGNERGTRILDTGTILQIPLVLSR
jgi:hypothetical protein